MSTEKEALARQKVIQKKQEQSEPGSQKDSGHGAALSAGDMAALQGMVGNTAVGQLGQIQRAPQDEARLEGASSAAFDNIVHRTPSRNTPVIQRKLEGTNAALSELGGGNVKLGGIYKSSWTKVLNSVQSHEELERTVSGKPNATRSDQRKLLSSLTKIDEAATAWIAKNGASIQQARAELATKGGGRLKGFMGNQDMEDNPAMQSDHLKMSAIDNLKVRVARERQMITENFQAWHASAAQADSQMMASDWNKDFAVGAQVSTLDKVTYRNEGGGNHGFYQPDNDYISPGASGTLAGMPKYEANFTGRALAMMRIDNLLTQTMLTRHVGQAGNQVNAPAPPPRPPRGGVALPGMQGGVAPGLPAHRQQNHANQQQNEAPTDMLVKTDLATHTRGDAKHKTQATTGVFLDTAAGQEMRGGYLGNGNAIMSNDQRQAGDENKLSLDDPKLQRSLNKLQLLDAICAQVDRHAGNFFVSLNAQGGVNSVQGIDNDMAFGKKITDPQTQRQEVDGQAMGQTAWRGLPPMADEELAQAILSLDAAQIRQAITGLVTDEEVEATIQRLESTQDYIRKLPENMRISPQQWEERRVELAQQQTKENSYLGIAKEEAVGGVWNQAQAKVNAYLAAKINPTQVNGFMVGMSSAIADKLLDQSIAPQSLQNDAQLHLFLERILDKLALADDDSMAEVREKVKAAMANNDIYEDL